MDHTFDFTIKPEHIHEGLLKVARHFVPEYASVPEADFEIKKLTGGVTNTLYRVSAREVPPRPRELPLVVRLYGDKTEEIIDRKRELVIQQSTWEFGVGPKLYGVYNNGCVYGFIQGSVLEPAQLSDPNNARLIAREMARWHNMHVPPGDGEEDAATGKRTTLLWHTITKYADMLLAGFPDADAKGRKSLKDYPLSLSLLKKEIPIIQSHLARHDSPIVFSHNDLLSYNILLAEQRDAVAFIDYEYASYNHRGFDIGNHFNEFAGFDCDYRLYPDEATQQHFIRAYMQASSSASTPSEAEVHKLYVEANQYALASHLFWGFWFLIQSQNSSIDFDYFSYSKKRFDQYFAVKDKMLALSEN